MISSFPKNSEFFRNIKMTHIRIFHLNYWAHFTGKYKEAAGRLFGCQGIFCSFRFGRCYFIGSLSSRFSGSLSRRIHLTRIVFGQQFVTMCYHFIGSFYLKKTKKPDQVEIVLEDPFSNFITRVEAHTGYLIDIDKVLIGIFSSCFPSKKCISDIEN